MNSPLCSLLLHRSYVEGRCFFLKNKNEFAMIKLFLRLIVSFHGYFYLLVAPSQTGAAFL